MLPLAGKTMVVIGGSRGVGRQIVASWYPRWRARACSGAPGTASNPYVYERAIEEGHLGGSNVVAMTATKPHQQQVSARPQQTFERVAEPFKLHCYRIGRNLPPLMFRPSGRTYQATSPIGTL
jgi:NAD(P)-dependent dehydrogenase (short-subunit alcohol dehydrogenase family)